MKHFLVSLSFLFFFYSCQQEKPLTAHQIINKSIDISGGEAYENLNYQFSFRKHQYLSKLENGNFEYTRISKDSLTTMDSYGNNKPFTRTINSEVKTISDSLADKIKNAINSVNYFVLLPFGLNDTAVNKKYLNEVSIKDKQYYKIEVTFNEDGGGDDFDDVYMYWISTETFKIDYLAYSFTVNGGGMRFREAYNERFIKGVRFVNYKNYKPKNTSATLENLDVLFEANNLKLLSTIETTDITVD